TGCVPRPRLPLFPTRRSSDLGPETSSPGLFFSELLNAEEDRGRQRTKRKEKWRTRGGAGRRVRRRHHARASLFLFSSSPVLLCLDRKSPRLYSIHVKTSYALF